MLERVDTKAIAIGECDPVFVTLGEVSQRAAAAEIEIA